MRTTIRLLLFIFISSLLFNISCKKEKEAQEGDIEVIVNEDKPQNPFFSLKFEEDLSISKKGWWPADVAVDDEENIYIFGEAENFIYKFDSQGNEVFKKIFPKGQGPGDFFFMDPFFSSDGKLYLFDKVQQRIYILNKACEVQDSMEIKGQRFLFRMDSKGNMFFFVNKLLPRSSKMVDKAYKKVLTKFSPSGKPLNELFEFNSPRPEVDREKMIFNFPLYFTCGMYNLDSDDNVYYAISDKYEINIVSSQGKLVKRIVKKGQPRKVTKRDIEIQAPPVDETSPFKTKFIAPERVPLIADFFILENNYILVITHENDYEEEVLAGDLFNERGIYLTRVNVPKYHEWYKYTSFYGIKKKALYKKDHFYIIESDKNEENFYVKRYKMIWNDK